MITKADVEEAMRRVEGRVRRTPVMEVEANAFGLSPKAEPVTLKLELFQHTGSFKVRGAYNAMLSAGTSRRDVIAASGGNAGAAVAYAAQQLGMNAEIFVPEAASRVKVERLRRYGARVTVAGAYYSDAYEASMRKAQETGALTVHAYDQPEVQAGQGTLAAELLEQVGQVDTVLVAVGGGGLFAGVATWLSSLAHVVAVEPEQCPTLATALKCAEPTSVDVGGVAADSLGAQRISESALAIARRDHITSVLVSDKHILEARQLLWDELRIAAEPGGATALAALTSGSYLPRADERVAVIMCGGNTDPVDLGMRE